MPCPNVQVDDSGDSDFTVVAEPVGMRNLDEKGYGEGALENETDEEENDESSSGTKSSITGKLSGSMEDLERLQSSEGIISDEVRECLDDCIDCYKTCTESLTKCLAMGGKHAKFEHINLLMDCAKTCSINADFILRNSTYYPQTCGITADICDECADTCDRFHDDFMKECANVCRRCSESCREMAR